MFNKIIGIFKKKEYSSNNKVIIHTSLTPEKYSKLKEIIARKEYELKALKSKEVYEINCAISCREQKIKEAIAFEQDRIRSIKLHHNIDMNAILSARNKEISAISP